MADSFVTFTGDGTTTIFSIPFDYLDNTHITALVDNVETPITFPSVGQAQFSVAPANGASGKILRTTPRDAREVVWQNAANLSAGDLNTSDLQLLFIAQESFDAVVNTVQDAIDAGVSANTAEAAAVAAASSASDAATTYILVQAIYDDFDDAYLGAKASDPSVDNDGDTLNSGDLYYNTTSSNLRIYDEGSVSWLVLDLNILDDSITNTKLSNMAQGTIKGRANASGTGDPVDLTPAQIRTIADVYSQSETYTQAEVDALSGGVLYESDAVATTSGTTIDHTGIDANGDVNEVIIWLDEVSTSGDNQLLQLQIGDSGGLESSGYSGYGGTTSNYTANSVAFNLTDTSGFDAINLMSGSIILRRITGNKWSVDWSGNCGRVVITGTGSKTLTGTLDRIRLTTSGGTATFDNGNFYVKGIK